ncbi:RpiB/LacA/LacB family sugar-phosphate isomerase [Candidatus Saccharibacteria bacterium]|nr:RpiB/LacA/LacB family sugar-phosphate isomerase [Candidatus Saccharibacteria bacterium]
MTKLFIGADHRGFEKKNQLADYFKQNYEVIDLGAEIYQETDDYNDFAIRVAKAVLGNPGSKGILLCGSAHGISIQANRFKGVRAIVGYNIDLAKLGREHNDANVLCLSSDYQDLENMKNIADVFLNTQFLNEERLVRRNNRLDEEVM